MKQNLFLIFFGLLFVNEVDPTKSQLKDILEQEQNINNRFNEPNHKYKEYSGKSLLRFKPDTLSHLNVLKRIEKRQQRFKIKFWASPDMLHRNVDIVVPNKNLSEFLTFIKRFGIEHTIVERDISRMLQREHTAVNYENLKSTNFNLSNFNSYNSTMTWLEDIVRICSFCRLLTIGKSFEGRDIKLIRIGRAFNGIFIDAGIHAREWGSITSTLHLIKKLTDTSDELGRYLLSKFTFHILPIANPDGYEYSRNWDREWRKTRTTKYSRNCPGVDPNRNFALGFGGEGSSRIYCDETYRGPYAFSEPETKALSRYVLQEKGRLTAYLAVHSYGRMIVFPWGCNNSVTADYNDLNQVAIEMKGEIEKYLNVDYIYGPTGLLLYVASGGSDDWAKGAGVKFTYTMEIGENFVLAPKDIKPLSEELINGVKGMVDAIAYFYQR